MATIPITSAYVSRKELMTLMHPSNELAEVHTVSEQHEAGMGCGAYD